MNGEQFHSALHIAGNCLSMANDSLHEASEHACSPAAKNQLLHAQESLDNCAVIIKALKQYLDAHPHALPTEAVLPFRHCL
ncbi:hypothetical protein AAFN46_19105 [Pseudomonas sp. CAU 1711]|uniref:hypothetical protein n=1 Tax=Pseudomonas sp. CAU 1711 TaxID=3140356 RepID=UPI0032614ACA